MSRKSFQPAVGKAFHIDEQPVTRPWIRFETILFSIVVFGMCWLVAAGIYGAVLGDFTYLSALSKQYDKYLFALFGLIIGHSHGRTYNAGQFPDG